jgi:hypothetical protein
LTAEFDVDKRVGGVGRRFDVNHCEAVTQGAVRQYRLHLLVRRTCREGHGVNAELAQHAAKQVIRAPVQRLVVENHVAWAHICQHRGRNRRHTAFEHRAVFRLVPQAQAVF